jgi:hypothetical protein
MRYYRFSNMDTLHQKMERPYHCRATGGTRSRLEVQIFNDLLAGDDTVRTRSVYTTDDDAYTSESRVATSPTLSFTTGVIGAKMGSLL